MNETEKQSLIRKIKENPDQSITRLVGITALERHLLSKNLHILEALGHIECIKAGRNKRWRVTV